jgi:hypothetical protein
MQLKHLVATHKVSGRPADDAIGERRISCRGSMTKVAYSY